MLWKETSTKWKYRQKHTVINLKNVMTVNNHKIRQQKSKMTNEQSKILERVKYDSLQTTADIRFF